MARENFLDELLSGKISADDPRIAITSMTELMARKYPLYMIGCKIPSEYPVPNLDAIDVLIIDSNPDVLKIDQVSPDTYTIRTHPTTMQFISRMMDWAKKHGKTIVTRKKRVFAFA